MKLRFLLVITLLLAAVLLVVSGCGTKTTTTTTTPDEPAYANTMAENILTAINDENFVNFSRDFDQAMKDALPESGFSELYNYVKSKAGDYISKQYYTTVEKGGYTTVVYIAKYSEKENVTVNVTFSTVDGKNLVSGLHFPNLQ